MVTSTKKSTKTKSTIKSATPTRVTAAQNPAKNSTSKKEIPVLVKVISIFYFIGAAVDMILGLIFILAAQTIASILQEVPLLSGFGSTIAVALGICLFAMGIFNIFVGRGLWLAQSWARITLIILHIVGALFAVYSIIMGNYVSIFSLLLSLAVLGYFVLSEDVKNAFA